VADELPILVVAGDYRQFVYWCRQNEINPRGREAVYVSELRQLMGRRGNPYVTVGTYYARRDWGRIHEELRVIEAVKHPCNVRCETSG
jgi:hypothetical protein